MLILLAPQTLLALLVALSLRSIELSYDPSERALIASYRRFLFWRPRDFAVTALDEVLEADIRELSTGGKGLVLLRRDAAPLVLAPSTAPWARAGTLRSLREFLRSLRA